MTLVTAIVAVISMTMTAVSVPTLGAMLSPIPEQTSTGRADEFGLEAKSVMMRLLSESAKVSS